MTYRPPAIDVPADNPFRFDALHRKPLVEFLGNVIEKAAGPFVLALDSPWGTGKSTLLQMLRAHLGTQGLRSVYFNAWEVDYVGDPLVPLVSAIDLLDVGSTNEAKSFRHHLTIVKRITSIVARRALIGGVKAVTAGAIDLDEEVEKAVTEFAGQSVEDAVDAFQHDRDLLMEFRKELTTAVSALATAGHKLPIVILVDELDRCRPDFALSVLERMKHLFDVSDVLFVLAIDKAQLATSMIAVYGQGLDAEEYLRRFIDLEFALPQATAKGFTQSLFGRFGLEAIFEKRTAAEVREDRETFISLFSALAQAVGLSLRAQERCFTRLRIVMDQTPENHYLHPTLVAVLIVLRVKQPDLYWKIVQGGAGAEDVMAYINSCPKGPELVQGRTGRWLHAQVLAAEGNAASQARQMAELGKQSKDMTLAAASRERAQEVWEMAQRLKHSAEYRGANLAMVSKKIDLTAQIRD